MFDKISTANIANTRVYVCIRVQYVLRCCLILHLRRASCTGSRWTGQSPVGVGVLFMTDGIGLSGWNRFLKSENRKGAALVAAAMAVSVFPVLVACHLNKVPVAG